MNRILVPILVVLVIGSVSTTAWFIARPADPRLGKLDAELKAARAEIAELKADLARRTTAPKASASPAEVSSASSAQRPKAAPNLPAAPSDGQAKSGSSTDFREMFKNPGMRAMIDQQQAMQIDMGYAKLFGYFNLTEEERAHFKKLLVEREKAQMDLGLKMMDEKLTPEQRKKLTADFNEQKKAFDAAFKTFLNDDNDWATFQHWEDTKPERMTFDMMGRSAFEASGAPLSPQQEQQLIDLMVRVRKEPSGLPNLSDPANFDPTHLTAEMMQRQLEQADANARKVAEGAKAFLNPAQLQALNTMNEQIRNMSEMGMKMTETMMKGGQK